MKKNIARIAVKNYKNGAKAYRAAESEILHTFQADPPPYASIQIMQNNFLLADPSLNMEYSNHTFIYLHI